MASAAAAVATMKMRALQGKGFASGHPCDEVVLIAGLNNAEVVVLTA